MFNLQENLKKICRRKNSNSKDGFLQSKFVLNGLVYEIENDLLKISDEKNDCYIKINLNQVYRADNEERKIKLYVDNDATHYYRKIKDRQ